MVIHLLDSQYIRDKFLCCSHSLCIQGSTNLFQYILVLVLDLSCDYFDALIEKAVLMDMGESFLRKDKYSKYSNPDGYTSLTRVN